MKGLWNGFDFYYVYLDMIYRIIRIFSPAARGISAEGRIIQTILLILSSYFFKIGIHSPFSFKSYSFFLDQTGRFFGQRRCLYETLQFKLRFSQGSWV